MREVNVAVSGGFDPLHVGHVRMLKEAKKYGDYLTVILNDDAWLMRKKGYVFMKEQERAEILEALECVDEVYIHHGKDDTVCDALEMMCPDIFANGGDRRSELDIPEYKVCEENDIRMVFGVGGDKIQSSSELVANVV